MSNLASTDGATVTMVAQWAPIAYSVAFDANGGEGKMADQQFSYDTAQQLTANAFSRTGYDFAGWRCGDKAYADGQEVKNLASTDGATVTLVAQWAAHGYKVRFDPNGGSGIMADQAFAYGTAQRLARNAFARTGYDFEGWKLGGTTYADGQEVKNLSSTDGATVTLVAQWAPNTHTVSFEANGGSKVAAQRVAYGGKAKRPADPTRKGHSFGGWYSDKALTKAYDFSSAVTGDVTVYAKWKADTHTVSFEANGGSRVAAQRVAYGKADPTRTGHSFGGWFTDKALTKAYGFGAVTSDVTVYAKWEANTYVVTFAPNGGSRVAAQRVAYGGKAKRPADPTRRGHSFKGWYSDKALTKAYDFSTPVTGDVTVYARWKADTHTVSFDPEGGTEVGPQKVRDGGVVVPGTPTREGYDFCGWYEDEALTKAYDPKAPVTGDIVLHAKWRARSYDVRFAPNGGSKVASQRVAYGRAAKRPADPTRKGHSFEGWYSDKALTKRYDFSSAVTSSRTLHAKWAANTYAVTFAPNGGSRVKAQRVAYGGRAARPADPRRKNHAFLGWYRDKALTRRYDFKSKVTGDLTLYAGWECAPLVVSASVARSGWLPAVTGGAVAGTTGRAIQLEALALRVGASTAAGGIEYNCHRRWAGWERGWSRDGRACGSDTDGIRLEAVHVRLYGALARRYDVWYRVHVRGLGWMSWTSNGRPAGTTHESRRAEALQAVLVPKGQGAPPNHFQGASRTFAGAFRDGVESVWPE